MTSWDDRVKKLNRMTKGQLAGMYRRGIRAPGGNTVAYGGGLHPLEKWDKQEIINAILGIEFPEGNTVRWSPDFDAYARGELDVNQVRCVLCGHAPCQCRSCPVIYVNRFAAVTGGNPEPRECGMTVGPDGKCPRGHDYPMDHCPVCAHRNGTCDCPCCPA